jgi:hypothetical protein
LIDGEEERQTVQCWEQEMLGKRSPQGDLFGADTQYLKFVGEDSFYGFLACEGRKLFRDEDFAALYCQDNGRTSVPPSLLAMALLLQTHDRVSDEEVKARADFDLRWKVALGVEIDTRCPPEKCYQLRAGVDYGAGRRLGRGRGISVRTPIVAQLTARATRERGW